MNELHLRNPAFLEVIEHIHYSVDNKCIEVFIQLSVMNTELKKSYLWDVHLISFDNIFADRMLWQGFSPSYNYSFNSFQCIEEKFPGKKIVDERVI
jgi:hypothetical protein